MSALTDSNKVGFPDAFFSVGWIPSNLSLNAPNCRFMREIEVAAVSEGFFSGAAAGGSDRAPRAAGAGRKAQKEEQEKPVSEAQEDLPTAEEQQVSAQGEIEERSKE